MNVMGKESFLVCQKCGYMCSIEYHVTSGRFIMENPNFHTKEGVTV